MVIMLTLLLIGVSVRLLYIMYRNGKPLKSTTTDLKPPRSTLIVLGSGGHTAEMINVMNWLEKERFMPRYYIAASTDNISLNKATSFEATSLIPPNQKEMNMVHYMQIYRSREVGQSYITSIGTTLYALAHALWLMVKIRPQVILCNGPGTCIPLCAIAFIFKILGINWSSIFYIESIARVKRLSLSGLLLYKLRMADQIYVQWPQLQRKYPRSIYVGCLM